MTTPNHILPDLLRGRGAHVDPVASLEGISADLAGERLVPSSHTIWELVWHMNYWMDYELRSFTGPEAAYPQHASASWPEAATPPSEHAWREETARFRRHVDQLSQWAERAMLEGIGGRVAHPGKGETIQDVLWQVVAHNSYHIGQVALLRRMAGQWPPPGGGDTW
jgi:uncharacterized damage-inducible protein DinB